MEDRVISRTHFYTVVCLGCEIPALEELTRAKLSIGNVCAFKEPLGRKSNQGLGIELE